MSKSRPRKPAHTRPRDTEASTTLAPLPMRLLALLVVVPVIFNAVMLWPELLSGAPSRNDNAFHLLMINGASNALAAGQNPLDFWIPQLELGFPQFLYYQNFPHLVVVALNRLMFGAVELETIYRATVYLLLVGFPLTVYWSMRRMGFNVAAAATSAAAASLLSTNGRYGLEYNSYMWRGFGLYTQLWGTHLTFIAIACLHYALKHRQTYWAAIASLALLGLSHLVMAYMMSITGLIVLVAVAERRTIWTQTLRFGAIGLAAVAVASYMLIPFVQSSLTYMSRLPELGGTPVRASGAMNSLLFGRFLDYDRLPVLTILVALGALVAILRYKRADNEANRLALGGFCVWFFLYAGHPTVGPLAKLFPAHDGYITGRFISVVHVFAIMMIGAVGQWIWENIGRLPVRAATGATSRVRLLAGPLLALAVVFAALTPAFVERARYHAGNRRLIEETRTALASDVDLRTILQAVAQQPGGRLYAGLRDNWGAQMRVGPTLRVADVVRYLGIASVGPPYQSLSLNASLFWAFREGDEPLFDMLDVRWVITPSGATVPPFYKPVHQTSRYALHSVSTSGIAQYVGINERRSASTQRELYDGNRAWFVSDAINTRQFIRWDFRTQPGSFTRVEACPDGGRVRGERAVPGSVHVEVECGSASALVLKMTYHPNWRVTVDGNRVETFMLSPSFIGIDMPPGRHMVEAEYVGTRSKLPLLLFGLVVLLASFVLRNRLP